MNFIKTIWNHSFLGIFIDTISNHIQYKKDKKFISDTFYGPAFNLVLKQYLKTNFKKDWLGRLYGVVNPNINDGKYDFNNVIIEIDGDNTNNNEYVKTWVFKQMRLISNLFKIEKLYDYIDVDFKHVGPEELDNYLIVFDIVSRKLWAQSAKRLVKRIFFLLILVAIAFLSFKLFII